MSDSTNSKPSLDQRRAKHAWDVIVAVKQGSGPSDSPAKPAPGKARKLDEPAPTPAGPSEKAKRFGSQARKLPTRIIASGLGQALAFLKAKDYAPALLLALSRWVLYDRYEKEPPKGIQDDALLQAIIHGNSDFLRRATDEVLAYLLWLNRFAEAEKLTEGP